VSDAESLATAAPGMGLGTYTAVAQVTPDALRLRSTKCSSSSVKRELTSIMEHDR
jgi:hypothetical protein